MTLKTGALNQAVKRNPKRFPPDFMIQLTADERAALRAEIALSDGETTTSRYLPYAFTEQGVAMLSSVLKSDRAIEVNIAIIRAFVITRLYLSNYQELSKRIDALEKDMNRKFKDVHEALKYLVDQNTIPREIGFRQSVTS